VCGGDEEGVYQPWNNWALVSVAESSTSFESTKKKKCLKEREVGYLAAIPTTKSSSTLWESATRKKYCHL